MAELDTTWLDPRDRSYAESRDTGEREVVLSTVIRYRRPDQVRAGDALPELELARLDDGATVRLDTLAEERPVVLVFGSYTWPPFRRRSGDIDALYRRFRDRASIFFVYIAEAHATDEWQTEPNEQEHVLVAQHATLDERFAAAREGADRMRLTLPVLVDGMDNAVSEAFAAWPERIFVADRGGRIEFAGGPGPYEFDPDAAFAALARCLVREGG